MLLRSMRRFESMQSCHTARAHVASGSLAANDDDDTVVAGELAGDGTRSFSVGSSATDDDGDENRWLLKRTLGCDSPDPATPLYNDAVLELLVVRSSHLSSAIGRIAREAYIDARLAGPPVGALLAFLMRRLLGPRLHAMSWSIVSVAFVPTVAL